MQKIPIAVNLPTAVAGSDFSSLYGLISKYAQLMSERKVEAYRLSLNSLYIAASEYDEQKGKPPSNYKIQILISNLPIWNEEQDVALFRLHNLQEPLILREIALIPENGGDASKKIPLQLIADKSQTLLDTFVRVPGLNINESTSIVKETSDKLKLEMTLTRLM